MTGSPDHLHPSSNDLMSIGRFSALARISVRMLRHYDTHEVLVPAHVDDCTGYRRYSSGQLDTAIRIRRLRDAGLGVSAISTLLATRGTPAYAQALSLHRVTLQTELRVAQQRITLLDQLLHNETENAMNITITEKTYPAQTVVALRDVLPDYASEGQLWERFMPELQHQGIQTLQAPGGATNHDEGFKESDVDTSVWIPVSPDTRADTPLQVIDQPEQKAVAATLIGPLNDIGEAATTLARHLTAHGIQPTGPLSMRYLTDPSITPQEDQITELYFPTA